MSPQSRKRGEPHVLTTANKKQVKVAPFGSSRIQVTWSCDTRCSFTVDDLRERIEFVDEMKAFGDAWLDLTDSNQRRFFARFDNGNVTASNKFEDNDFVSWQALKRALQATIAEMATEPVQQALVS